MCNYAEKVERGAVYMNILVTADDHWGIGYQGNRLVCVPADTKYFNQETRGKVLVMSRKTLESFPNGLPPKERITYILTEDHTFQIKGAHVVHTKEELLKELSQYRWEDIYILGGAKIFETLLPYSRVVHVTKIDYTYQADAFFPNLDRHPEWELTEESEEQTYFNLEYYFKKYERKAE